MNLAGDSQDSVCRVAVTISPETQVHLEKPLLGNQYQGDNVLNHSQQPEGEMIPWPLALRKGKGPLPDPVIPSGTKAHR